MGATSAVPRLTGLTVLLILSLLGVVLQLLGPKDGQANNMPTITTSSGSAVEVQGAWMIRPFPGWWAEKLMCKSFTNLPGCPRQIYYA